VWESVCVCVGECVWESECGRVSVGECVCVGECVWESECGRVSVGE
jgi:hypothetical protein